MTLKQIWLVLAIAVLTPAAEAVGPAAKEEESHVRPVVARILDNVRKLREADPEAVPMAIWKALADAGVENYVVSANIEALVRNTAFTLGIPRDRIRGARTELDGGRWTTRLLQPIPHGEGKADIVRNLVRARPHGVAIAAFGNSYATDGAFLRDVATQPSLPGGAAGTAMMINGGKSVPGLTEHFICVEQRKTAGSARTP